MDTLDDIKRIIWHEFGHLCVDIPMVKSIKKLSITKLCIHHVNRIDHPFRWGGFVEVLPELKYTDAVKDKDYFTLKIITLFSGCVFETIYFHKVVGDRSINVPNCFNSRKEYSGYSDFCKFSSLLSELMKQHEEIRGNIKLLSFLHKEILDFYLELVARNESFLNALEKLINEWSELIFKDFEANGKPSIYEYEIEGNELKELCEGVSKIIEKNNFAAIIDDTINELLDKLIPFCE